VGNCDLVRFHIANASDYTCCIAGFYVDALGGVQTLSPRDKERGRARKLYSGTGGEAIYTIQFNTWDAANRKPATVSVENAVILAIPENATTRLPPAVGEDGTGVCVSCIRSASVRRPSPAGGRRKLTPHRPTPLHAERSVRAAYFFDSIGSWSFSNSGAGVKLSVNTLAGSRVLSAVGASPPHDGVG
jgi:hypothetical protein